MPARLRSLFAPVLLAALLLCAGALQAQGVPTAATQAVRGRVVDRATGEPISAASVRAVEESGNAAVSGRTDVAGNFSIRLPIAGTYVITAERIGFSTFTSGAVLVGRGATVEVELRLASAALALDSVAVRVREVPTFRDRRASTFWDRHDRRRGTFINPDQIAAAPQLRTSDFLRQVPQVALGGGLRASSVELGVAASRRCTPTLYIDGFKKRMHPEQRLDDLLDREALWAIEVYPTPQDAPPELPPEDDFYCGVIAIWTRHA